MGPKTISVLLALIGLISATPTSELKSNLEFLEYTTNLDEPAYRLRDNVQPRWMFVDLDVYLSESRFTGLVRAEIEITGTENLTQIVLHQNVVSITGVNVLDSDNNPVALDANSPFQIESYFELLLINLAEEVSAGQYTITISYTGVINENPFDRGFYKGYYYLGTERREYATTQFQPYHARKAFPCFDEPQFKSRFVISITRDTTLGPSYSNMAINQTENVATGRVRETFLPTPTISAYLIAFHVSDFVETTETGTAEKPFGIISRPGVLDQHAYAAEIGLNITNVMDAYFNISYYDMGEGEAMKNDHIALPDFPSGAMENWGMVNYRENYLLYDEANTNLPSKTVIATIMAHELAHKWFGNLVTCFWWSNLWLNESFASFFEYFSAHSADTSLELADQFVVDYLHSALNWDASSGATPMNWTSVVDNPSITSHFSVTSYAKGASVLRMMEHFVGETTFRDALRYYLRDNAYRIGTPEDMYQAFRTAVSEDSTFAQLYDDIDIGDVLDSWIQTPGSPVLDVNVNTDTGVIAVTQRRYQLSGVPHNMIWHLPLTWTHGGAPDFTSTKPDFVLSGASAVISMPAGQNWVIFNIAQSGLYRVKYDDNNWELLATALRNDRTVFNKLNRAQIVNDVLYFIRSEDITISRAFDVLSFLEGETDYYVWAGALGQLDYIRRRLEHIPAAFDEFNAYLLELMESAIQELGYEEGTNDATSVILNRMQILNYACNLGHEGCVADSLEKWNAFRQNNNAVPVNARRYVYCVGLRNGNIDDYNFLFQRYNASENTADMVVMLRALACTRDQSGIEHYLYQSLYNDRIRAHDRTNAFNFALQGNPENLETILNFVYRHYSDISTHYGGVARLNIALNALTAYLTDFEDITEFQTWAYNNQVELGASFQVAQNIVDSAIANIVWGNSVVTDIYSFLRGRNSAAILATPFALLFAAILAHFIR